MNEFLSDLSPEFLKIVKAPQFLAHEVDDDVSRINKEPSVLSRVLVTVADRQAELIEKPPYLMDNTFQMADGIDGSDYETVRP